MPTSSDNVLDEQLRTTRGINGFLPLSLLFLRKLLEKSSGRKRTMTNNKKATTEHCKGNFPRQCRPLCFRPHFVRVLLRKSRVTQVYPIPLLSSAGAACLSLIRPLTSKEFRPRKSAAQFSGNDEEERP